MTEAKSRDDFDQILESERKLIARRRAQWKLQTPAGEQIGLALSGGGIRSATFSLGVLRELSAQKLLHRFDYLSTVSGGAYIGSFFGGLFTPRAMQAPVVKPQPDDPDVLCGIGAQRAIKLLRESGRYLAPSGGLDYWFAFVLLVRNWLGLQLILGSIIFSLALVGIWLRHLGDLAHLNFGSPSILGSVLTFGPTFWLACILLAVVVGLGWAYWFTRRDLGSSGGKGWWAVSTSAVLTLLSIWLAIAYGYDEAAIVGGIGIFALLVWLRCWITVLRCLRDLDNEGGADVEQLWDAQRLWLTRKQATLARAAVIVALLTLIDLVGFESTRKFESSLPGILAWPALSAVFVPLARSLLGKADIMASATNLMRIIPRKFLLQFFAAILVVALLLFWELLAYAVAWDANLCTSWPYPATCDPPIVLGVATCIAGLTAIGVAGTPSLLNLTSLATFYAGRLRRAYLGAGNPKRHDEHAGIERGVEGDDIQLTDYYADNGAPLHLISVTLNQTRGVGSTIIQRDRHGRNMTLGPSGISISNAVDRGCTLMPHVGDHEQLPLSTWVAISGASFSTGLGSRTGFGLTTLAGLANLRLGYWWRAGLSKPDRSVQRYFLNELRGAFAGSDEGRWYLSDGGHFDNTAIYELIRRRLTLIVASDNGQDEKYAYDDVANLIRKVRIDFGAEITFLDVEELDRALGRFSRVRRAFGTLAQVAGSEPFEPGAVATIAAITYADKTIGTLILIKPRLTGDGPADLIRYKEENVAFPQQPTLDQFFDEAQWESYYVLGRHVTKLVMGPDDGAWCPRNLKPLSKKEAARVH